MECCEDVAPQVVVVALFDDAPIFSQCEAGAAIDGCAGEFLEDHHHCPFENDEVIAGSDRGNVHVELFTAFGEAVAQSNEILFAFDALDAVLKDDVLMVVRKDVRPVRFALAV